MKPICSLRLQVLRLLLGLISWGVTCTANAAIEPLTQVEWIHPKRLDSSLPQFVQQATSGLMQVTWRITLPPSVRKLEVPALLLPQPVQGLTVRLSGHVIYSVPQSSATTLTQWYRPILVPLPHLQIQNTENDEVEVTQTGHLRGWYVSQALLGELTELQPWHDRFLFISSTLPSTVNTLSILIGFFVLGLGWRTRSSTYAFGGLTTVIWGVLFSLALVSELPMDAWFVWRLVLYACTGNLIYAVLRFLSAIFRQPWPDWMRMGVLLWMQLGWVSFALAGKTAEPWLDVIWTGCAVGIYMTGSLVIAIFALRRGESWKIGILSLHALFTIVLAWHDYVLQSGQFPLEILSSISQPWKALTLQPVYLTHLSLPVFVVISLWLLSQDHLQHRREQAKHRDALHQQRERIMRDIHDGVGARLNLMLWRTRTAPLVAAQMQDELERSIEELRFAINPPQTTNHTFKQALQGLAQRAARWGQPLGIQVQLIMASANESVLQAMSSECALHLYKAAHESVSNALRHSGASLIAIRVCNIDDAIELSIEDNGRGIPDWDASTQRSKSASSTSMGLLGIQRRLQSLGGQCQIVSNHAGTQVKLSLATTAIPSTSNPSDLSRV